MRSNPPSEVPSRWSQWIVGLESRANGITDAERHWWPFGLLQIAQEEPLSTRRVATLSLFFGIPWGFVLLLVDHHARGDGTRERCALFLASVCVAFFGIYRSSFAFFWNRRAARLKKLALRRKAWVERGRVEP